MAKESHPPGSHPPGGFYWGPDHPGGTPDKYEPPSNKNRRVLTALIGRSLGPAGVHGYWKDGDIQNTGGINGVNYRYTKTGGWVKV